jgi:hypothetical protein
MDLSLSLREQLYRDVMATVAMITTANGYATNIGTLTRGALAPLETAILPSLSLVPVSDETELGPGVLRRRLTFAFRAWVDTELADTATALEALIADVQRVMQVDALRGGLAEETLEGTVTYIYLQSTETLSGADIAFEVHYKTQQDSPLEQA